jgi:hypothetical protein
MMKALNSGDVSYLQNLEESPQLKSIFCFESAVSKEAGN